MNAEKIITFILSGSCTPASDLLAAVEAGTITYAKAWEAYCYRRRVASSGLTEAAAAESDFMRRWDI